ncbi:MAG: TIM barrel protein [Saprospiraceae bacterium]|jgi:hydroxypyruvate isomerase|nr:TIM barrel protein [Saprospiraceae bacterium]
MNRREVLKNSVLGTSAYFLNGLVSNQHLDDDKELKGNINHSVCRWTYDHLALDELCVLVKKIGFKAIDLIGPKDWSTLKKYNIDSSMCNGAEIGLTKGWNDVQYHQTLIENYSKHIKLVASAGYKNLICFSGNRDGKDDELGLNTCVIGLKKIIGLAEKSGVIIQMELFNSKIDHKDYMCDSSAWGIELCKRLDSPNFKLLYDIYHMQINEGDIIRTIKENHVYFGHYHTAGVPGRNEIDENQELNYPAIMKAILATGFDGYVAQEYIPTSKTIIEKEKALQKAIKICDV